MHHLKLSTTNRTFCLANRTKKGKKKKTINKLLTNPTDNHGILQNVKFLLIVSILCLPHKSSPLMTANMSFVLR